MCMYVYCTTVHTQSHPVQCVFIVYTGLVVQNFLVSKQRTSTAEQVEQVVPSRRKARV